MAEQTGLAAALLEAARVALGDRSPFPADRRARAAAALARTALEREIDQRLDTIGRARGGGPHGPGIRGSSKLIALRALDGTDMSVQATYAWNALSSACHQHAYDLSPSATEVNHLVTLVEKLVSGHPAPDDAGAPH